MRETEITVQVFEDVDVIRGKLESLGFTLDETYTLDDYYYSKYDSETLKGFKYLDILNNSILIRQIVDNDGEQVEMIFKSKTMDQNDNVISEEKIKTKVDSFEKARKVLELGGLNMWCNLFNFSYNYSKGETAIALQVIKDLGVFIEFEENDTMKDMNEEEKFNYMKDILLGFGLKLGEDFSAKKVYMKFMGK